MIGKNFIIGSLLYLENDAIPFEYDKNIFPFTKFRLDDAWHQRKMYVCITKKDM